MLLKILDWVRILAVGVAFFLGYQIGFQHGYDPFAQLHFMTPIIILAVAGISGLEGLLCGKRSAELKGYETDSNYQKQSAIALLSYAVIAVIVYLAKWGIKAELTILFCFLFFLIFSALNHALQAIKKKNYQWQNINRPFITLMLIAGLFYPVLKALQKL